MKVKSTKYGMIHAYAQCRKCEWNAAINMRDNNRMQKLRNKIHSHVKATGHVVDLEAGNATKYELS